jgi:hypothetical protein
MNEEHDLFYDPDDEVTKSEVEDNYEYEYEYDDRSAGIDFANSNDF